ncbi:MAG: hypothetical protein AAGA65_26975 [Actinomycetota bacterium]
MTDRRPEDLSDDELESLVEQVLRPSTAARRKAAAAAIDLTDLDAELARLVEDSRLVESTGLRDASSTSYQVTIDAGPSRLVVDVERSSDRSVEIVVLVADGPVPQRLVLRLADGERRESATATWPRVFAAIRSTTMVRIEIGIDAAESIDFVSPWIGL